MRMRYDDYDDDRDYEDDEDGIIVQGTDQDDRKSESGRSRILPKNRQVRTYLEQEPETKE